MLEKLSHNFRTALESLNQNKLRALLTSLGIIFGVASVISMMAIGRGAKEEVLQQLVTLGSNNIILKAKAPVESNETGNEELRKQTKRFSPGLSLKDCQSILKSVPGISLTSPEVGKDMGALYEGKRVSAKVTGVTNEFFSIGGFDLVIGTTFTENQAEYLSPVCIIGKDLKTKLFASENPVGKQIKCGRNWLTVIGVVQSRTISETSSSQGLHDYKMEVFLPLKTYLLRFEDRSRVNLGEMEESFRFMFSNDEQGSQEKAKNIHQIDKITIVVNDNSKMTGIAEIIARLVKRRHNGNEDFEIVIPEMLLKQQQETQATFGYVLISIAAISLLVGGIGIMNIMLASVMERIKEIGVRLALGATRSDIILQFLSEAVTISFVGGLIGIFTGLLASYLIEYFTGVLTIVTPGSVIVAFFVSISIGILFGLFPARKAAMQDPVVCLRYE